MQSLQSWQFFKQNFFRPTAQNWATRTLLTALISQYWGSRWQLRNLREGLVNSALPARLTTLAATSLLAGQYSPHGKIAANWDHKNAGQHFQLHRLETLLYVWWWYSLQRFGCQCLYGVNINSKGRHCLFSNLYHSHFKISSTKNIQLTTNLNFSSRSGYLVLVQ